MKRKKNLPKPVKSQLRIIVIRYRNKLYFQLVNFLFDKLEARNVKYFCGNGKITVLRDRKTLARMEFREIEDDRTTTDGFIEQYPWVIMKHDDYCFSRVLLPQWFKPGDILLFNYTTPTDKLFAHRVVPEKITPQDAAAYMVWPYAWSICASKVYNNLGNLLLGKRKQVDFNSLIAAYTQKAVYQGKEFRIINFSKLD